MTTAFELGELTARVKVAGANPVIATTIPENLNATKIGDFAPMLEPKFQTSSVTGRIAPQPDFRTGGSPLANPKAPIFGNLFNPDENKNYGESGLRGSAAKFVPQKEFPYASKDARGDAGEQMDARTYQALLAKHYSSMRPFGFNVPQELTSKLMNTLPLKAFMLHPGEERNATYSAANELYRNAAKAPQKQKYEDALKNMQDLAFKQRTSKPFYYDEHNSNKAPVVEMTPQYASDQSASIMRMPPASAWKNAPDNSLMQMLTKPYPAMTPEATKLHEHVHTTQNVNMQPTRYGIPSRMFQHELPAVLSESAHAADAYHKATGQWPKGEIMGMPYSAFVEDLRQRGHLGGSTQMSAVMNDPKYQTQLQKMIDEQHGKFDQQDVLTNAVEQITRNPRVALTAANLATAGTPINASLQALTNLIPAGQWGEESKRMPETYSSGAVPSKRYNKNQTTFSPVPQTKYDASGKAIPRGPRISTQQRRFDADGKAIP